MNTAPSILNVSASFRLACATALFPLAVAAQEDPDDIVSLDRVAVQAARAETYTTAAAPSATKLDVPLLESPRNIQVVPRSLMDDQAALKLEDVLRNVAGVMPGGYYDNWDYYRIRGFAADFNVFIDGLRGGNGMGEEIFGLEQVEVVKGPASSLFGQGPVSGLVNLVSKRPKTGFLARTELSAGSFGYRSASLDFNSPLGSSDALLFRLPVLFEDQDSFVDAARSRTWYFGPALTWQIAPDTSLTLLGKYKATDVVHAMPLPAAGTILPNPNGSIALDRYIGEPGSNRAYEDSGQIGYEFVHEFSGDLRLRQNLRYDRYVQGWRDLLYPSHLSADGRIIYRYPYNYWQDWRDLAVDTRLEATLRHGALTHQLVAGLDHYRKNYAARFQTIDFSDPANLIGLDLFQPVYGTPIPAYQPIATNSTRTRNTGFYLHDHLTLARGLTVTAGGRYDFADSGTTEVEAFTPTIGATWEFRRGAALFANYSESFNPQTWQTDAQGYSLDPETGTNREVGLKTAAADGRLTATFAVYELTRQNVATADLAHPGAYLVTGKQRSRGFEFDGRFSPLPGWELTTAYAYTDARITADNTLPVGARTNGVPYHSFNAWTKYVFPSGPWKGFGAGAGLRYYSDQFGDQTYTHTFYLPAYALVDLAFYYTRGRFSAQVNVGNLFDREYYSGAYNDVYVLPGEPRSVRVSLAWKY